MQKALPWAIAVSAALAAAPLGCDGGSGNTGGGGKGGSGTTAGTGGNGGDLIGVGGNMTSAEVVPGQATIVVKDGVSTPVDFDLLVSGSSVGAKWYISKTSVADIDGDGIATATGVVGGDVTVTGAYGSTSATASLTVKIEATANPGGINDTDIGILKAATTPDATTAWLYPYPKTVFPKGIFEPELMWSGGSPGDEYYVRYKTKFVTIEYFTKIDPPARFLPDSAAWKAISESGKGAEVELFVARLTPGQATATVVTNHTWTIAPGPLRGSVYYWSNSVGRVLRIKPGLGTPPEDFLAAAGINYNCSTCHAVSANGQTLVIGGDVNTSTFNLLTNTPVLDLPNVGKPVRNWAMPAISPDGQLLIENNAPLPGPPGGSDGVWNAQTGMKITGTGLDGVFLDMPAWSPSGAVVAYVRHEAGHDLMKYLFDPGTGTFSGQTTLVEAGGDPTLNAIAFPTVAPTASDQEFGDTTWIGYHRGVYPSSLDTRYGPGDLFLASADMPGTEIRLRNANGDDYAFPFGDRDRHYNYEPAFAPQEAGGYHWMVFTSRRTYGNRLTGDPSATKQLWITAIDRQPTAGTDPSHPPFLIPGQDLTQLNMRGFWAHDPCLPQGSSCELDSLCCSGNCDNGICAGDNPEECSGEGEYCNDKSDCCDPTFICLPDNTCGPDEPQ